VQIILTGHSLGGALATLAAYDLQLFSDICNASNLTVITFGCPRVGAAAARVAAVAIFPDNTRVVVLQRLMRMPSLHFCLLLLQVITHSAQTTTQRYQIIGSAIIYLSVLFFQCLLFFLLLLLPLPPPPSRHQQQHYGTCHLHDAAALLNSNNGSFINTHDVVVHRSKGWWRYKSVGKKA